MFFFKRWRRSRLTQIDLPQHLLATLERRLPYYRLLPAEEQRRLRRLVQVFMAEKRFEGCGGLKLRDEIRVTVAGGACILQLGLRREMYPKLRSILIYPFPYLVRLSARRPDGTVIEGRQGRLGESWSQGYVVLSWSDVLEAAASRNGRNVLFHEFAHQLDSETGGAEGAPLLPDDSLYAEWARVLGAEYEALIESVERKSPTLIDPYGATSPAEFFAVVTELFFGLPIELEECHPFLYGQLKLFYRQDPAALMRGNRGRG